MDKALVVIVLLVVGALLFSGCASTENKPYDKVVEKDKTTITVETTTTPIVTTIEHSNVAQSNLKDVVLGAGDVESRFSSVPEMSGAINLDSGYMRGYGVVFVDSNPSDSVINDGQPTLISSVVYDYTGRESERNTMFLYNKTNEIGHTIGDITVRNVKFLGTVDNIGEGGRMWLTEGETVVGGEVYETQDVVLMVKKTNYLVLITTLSSRNGIYYPLASADKKYARIVVDRLN